MQSYPNLFGSLTAQRSTIVFEKKPEPLQKQKQSVPPKKRHGGLPSRKDLQPKKPLVPSRKDSLRKPDLPLKRKQEELRKRPDLLPKRKQEELRKRPDLLLKKRQEELKKKDSPLKKQPA